MIYERINIRTDAEMHSITLEFIPPMGGATVVTVSPAMMRSLIRQGELAADYIDRVKESESREGVQASRQGIR